MNSIEKLISVIEVLNQIEKDMTVPRNIRARVISAILALQEDKDQMAVKVDKAIQELSEIDSDPNISQYTRTQIWNVVSVLECK